MPRRALPIFFALTALAALATPILADLDSAFIGHIPHFDLGQGPMPGDGAGTAVASGDFDGDGLEDFAIGVPFMDVDGVEDRGMVYVRYRQGTAAQTLFQTTGDGAFVNFGAALAASDFDGDGYDDLVVGVPGYPGPTNRGGYVIFEGSEDGLTSPFFSTAGSENARLGSSLAVAGNWLFVGAPGQEIDGEAVGAVFYENADPIADCPLEWIHQDWAGVPGVGEDGDGWGSSLATADYLPFLGLVDLWVGAPQEDIGAVADAGAVWNFSFSFFGTCDELDVIGAELFYQGDGQVPGVAEAGDRFGEALAAGDFDGDGRDGVAVGVPREDRESDALGDTGCVHVLNENGSDACRFADDLGLTATPGQQMGSALAAGDHDFNGFDDLLIGVPGADRDFGRQGAVILALGSSMTGASPYLTFWDAPEQSNSFANFGSSVAFFEAGNKPALDLLVGIPGFDAEGQDRSGITAQILLSNCQILVDGFETGDFSRWDGVVNP